jgi:hypothetical protein
LFVIVSASLVVALQLLLLFGLYEWMTSCMMDGPAKQKRVCRRREFVRLNINFGTE